MALEVSCYDGESKHIPVESSTTAHDFAMHVLQVEPLTIVIYKC